VGKGPGVSERLLKFFAASPPSHHQLPSNIHNVVAAVLGSRLPSLSAAVAPESALLGRVSATIQDTTSSTTAFDHCI
jgi:hypothetical protein